MKHFLLFFLWIIPAFSLAGNTADMTALPELPEKIYFKTTTATFTVDYYFILVDGKIYYKRNQEVTNPELLFNVLRGQDPAGANEWKLLEPNGMASSNFKQGIAGLPNEQRRKTKKYDTPGRIVQISADNSMLIALSEDNQFYYCYLNDGSKFYNIRGWTDRWGTPKKILNYADTFKAWQVGRRSEKVEWFEDPNGYRRSYSGYGLSTIYALSKDGRDIYFIDNGMPQSFHDIIAGPHNGEFVAESISVSGETIFLMDMYGTMYTRLADFDTIGDDVMLYKYTYKELPLQMPNTGRHFQSSQFLKEYANIAVKLPPEPWLKQVPIPTGGARSITKNITILTTGKGNAGRELRVAGTDEEGRPGYYFKNIFAQEWQFRQLDYDIKPEDIIENDPGQINLAGTIRKKYSGTISLNNKVVLEGSLDNFTAHYSPSTIDPALITLLSGDEEITIKLHMVNTWNPYFNPAEYPYHPPRTFLATLEMPDTITVEDPKAASILKRLYKQINLKNFSFFVEAGKNYVRIYQKKGLPRQVVMNFVREEVKVSDIEKRRFLDPLIEDNRKFYKLTQAENLIVNQSGDHSVSELKEKLAANIDLYLTFINFRKESRRNSLKSHINAFGFKFAQGFFFLSGTILIPESMHLYKNMGILFNTNARKHYFMQLHSREDYRTSLNVLTERMEDYYSRLAAAGEGTQFASEYLAGLQSGRKEWLAECRRGYEWGKKYPGPGEGAGFIAGWNIYNKMKPALLKDEEKAWKEAEKLFLERYDSLYGTDVKQRTILLKQITR